MNARVSRMARTVRFAATRSSGVNAAHSTAPATYASIRSVMLGPPEDRRARWSPGHLGNARRYTRALLGRSCQVAREGVVAPDKFFRRLTISALGGLTCERAHTKVTRRALESSSDRRGVRCPYVGDLEKQMRRQVYSFATLGMLLLLYSVSAVVAWVMLAIMVVVVIMRRHLDTTRDSGATTDLMSGGLRSR